MAEFPAQKRRAHDGGISYCAVDGPGHLHHAECRLGKGGTLFIQAGGRVAVDSDREAEFQESNEAKALTQAARDAGLFVAPRGGN